MSQSSSRLLLIHDNMNYPYLGLRVCLSGPSNDRWGIPKWLGRAGCRIVDDPTDADFVVFTGGHDVNPELYGEKALNKTYFDLERDEADIALWQLCRREGIPMVGICRGAQFLWVMKGGKLFQDVDNHNDGVHEILVFKETKKYQASSVHHQMIRPEALPGMKLLANATESRYRESEKLVSSGMTSDFEIYTFPDEAIIAFQGHPEYDGFPNYSELCIRLINQYIYENDKTGYKKARLRLDNVIKIPEAVS